MASRQAIIDRSSELEQLLLQILKSVVDDPSESNFHKLRVTIKKIVAHLKLFRRIEPDGDRTLLRKKIRRIFKRAGSIRDLQVRLLQLAEAPQTSRIRKIIKKEKVIAERRILDFVGTTNLSGFDWINKSFAMMEQDLASHSIQQVSAGVESYMLSMLGKLQKLSLMGLHKEEHLHTYRIQLKQFYYNLLFLLQRGHLYRTFQQDLKLIDDLQEELGLWHDQYLLLKKMISERVKRKHIRKLQSQKEETRARIMFQVRNVKIVFRQVADYVPILIQNLNRESNNHVPVKAKSA